MRYLSKIIFINSAQIKYSEVNLDGNVHFIGTQGVGKSTVLRAILFFYNADTQKLGIKHEQKSYYEYYFPFLGSYIIFEVERETGPFCILCYKSQGRICFRFIESRYERAHFIHESGKAYDNWEHLSENLRNFGVHYSKKIERYEEYRDILYGNNEGKKDYRKFALLESKQYQNIPRTIQNVLLNSKLEAEFIKQTIIMSLNEEDIEINLQDYLHHLNGFEMQLADIKKWTETNKNGEIVIQKQAEQVKKLHTTLRHLERDIKQLSLQLAWAMEHLHKQLPQLKTTLDDAEARKKQLEKKISELDDKHKAKQEKQRGDIRVLEDKLKTAKSKSEDYARMKIQEIIQRVSQKTFISLELKNLKDERSFLTSRFADINHKYEALLKELENLVREFENSKEREKLKYEADFIAFKNVAYSNTEKLISEIKAQHFQSVTNARSNWEEKKKIIQDLKIKKERLKHLRLYEEETEALKIEVSELNTHIKQAEHKIEHGRSLIKTIQTQWELEESSHKEQSERYGEKLREGLEKLEKQIKSIGFKLQNSKNSFFGWLNENRPQWEENIGKVCDETILFQDGLFPELAQENGKSLFGVKIDLAEITKKVKSLSDYEDEKAAVNNKIENLKIKSNEVMIKFEEGLDNLKKKYQPQIKAQKETIDTLEYRNGKERKQLEEAQVNLHDIRERSQKEKERSLIILEAEIANAINDEKAAAELMDKIEEEISAQVKRKNRERDKNITIQEERYKGFYEEANAAILSKKEEGRKRAGEIQIRLQEELSGKGVDTYRLVELDTKIASLKDELDYIDNNRDKVVEYNQYKKDLFDKVEGFKNQKKLLEQQVQNEENKLLLVKQRLNDGMHQILEEISSVNKALNTIRETQEEYKDFTFTDCFKSIVPEYKEAREENKCDKTGRKLISELNQSYYSSIQRLDELKGAINKFSGNFSPQNIFNFKTNLVDTADYIQFAEELRDFIEENKIAQYEKRINERFADIVSTIGKETNILMSKGGEIQAVITKINHDFERKNFVGAIKKIELRLDPSANKVVAILLEIKKFNEEHIYSLGEATLFSTGNQNISNRKAVELLKHLLKEINSLAKRKLTLSDSFELKFRIEENQNDTGWVEKLANVGSEGTDILVKAMINIMLLNVFKEGASKRFADFRLHCMMDEIGKLHPNNVRGILRFANDRNILLVNGSPTENNALDYKHIYILVKDEKRYTKVKRITTNFAQVTI
ncbi:ATP-binding protein [soil metagenome]